MSIDMFPDSFVEYMLKQEDPSPGRPVDEDSHRSVDVCRCPEEHPAHS